MPIADTYRCFLATHPYRVAEVDAVLWRYIASGPEGASVTLVLLPGAPGRATAAFSHVLAFEGRCRVLAPDYPAELTTVRALLHGIAGILDAEEVAKACIVGGSFSGLIAQAFARLYPERVAALVLSDTGVPRPARAKWYTLAYWLLRILPGRAIRALWRLGGTLYLREVREDRAFWRGYFGALARRITKEECANRLRVWLDFDRHYRFAPGDVTAPTLLLDAERDAVFSPRERAQLRVLYPQASAVTFEGAGHAASIASREAYIEAIAGFVLSQESRMPTNATPHRS